MDETENTKGNYISFSKKEVFYRSDKVFFFFLLKGDGGIYRESMKHKTSLKTFGNMPALTCYFTHPFFFC